MTEIDYIKGNGNFCLEVIDTSSNTVVENYEDKNLVVNLGKTNISKLLGGDAAGKKISKIGIGTNGNNPDLADSALTNSFSKAIASVSYPDSSSVMYSWSLEANEGNGISIVEFGLLNDDGVLCARKVRAAIVKTANIRLVGTWKLTIN